MNTHDLGWRVEIREPSPDPSLPSSGRLLGYAQQLPDGRWEVVTRDGRRTTVGTRVEALLALAAMCETVGPGEWGEPDDTP